MKLPSGKIIPLIENALSLLPSITADGDGEYLFHKGDNQWSEQEIAIGRHRIDTLMSNLARRCNISKTITVDDCYDTWMTIARKKGILMPDENADIDVRRKALQDFAVAINPDRKYWFAMRCIDKTPAEIIKSINDEFTAVDIFQPEITRTERTNKGALKTVAVKLMQSIIFFRTSMPVAVKMKKAYCKIAYIYDYRAGDSRELAIIPSAQMKMFMYVNRTSDAEILYYFPDENAKTPQLRQGTEVTISEGEWKGARGTLVGPSRKHPLHVIVEVSLHNLGITIHAQIPHSFLTPIR